MWWIAEHVYAYRHVHRFAFLLCMLVLLSAWTGVRIQTETYGFARQKTHSGSRNLILIFWMSFLVDFRPKMAF